MWKDSLSGMTLGLVSMALMTFLVSPARAQYSGSSWPGTSSAAMPSYSFSGAGSYFGGSSSYVPFGGTISGFIPYSPVPGGGLGVQPGMRDSGMRMPPGGMRMFGTRPSLGLIRSATTPPAPIGLGTMGTRAGGVMDAMGGLIRRAPSPGSMGGMLRPPVGAYPFRVPPSLFGPTTAAPAMAM
jgi:hypothetical protein